MASPCSTKCARRAASACRLSRCGGSAQKIARMWNIWDKPSNPASLDALGSLQPGHDVDTQGSGDILRVTGLPQTGKRTVPSIPMSPIRAKSSSSTSTWMYYPHTYTVAILRLSSQRSCDLF